MSCGVAWFTFCFLYAAFIGRREAA